MDKIAYPYFKGIHSIKLHLEKRKGGGTPVIFNRPANLFAFQEVLEKVPDIDDSSFKWSGQLWENLLKYDLCVNDVISEYKEQEEDEKHTPFEKLTAASFFLNELVVVNDPILTMNRFVHLYKFLEIDNDLAKPLQDYFNKIGISPKDFVSHIFSTCFLSKSEKKFLRFHYYMEPDNPELEIPLLLFKYLCRRGLVAKLHELDVAELRKSPIFSDIDNHYIIVDNLFVIEKLYELFINDLWFEVVKPTGIDVRDYKSKIGYFFEQYASKVLREGLHKFRYPKIKCLDELKVNLGGQQIELADFYGRHNRKIILGQIKSTGIYSDQQYGTAQSLFRNTQDYFYKVFGLDQLITSLKYLRDHPEKFDDQFPIKKAVQVFPVLIVNEKIFQTALMPAMFHLRFKEELAKEKFEFFDVKPLTIIHINDLERVCFHIGKKNEDLWELLKANYTGSIFPKPFNLTLNRRKLNPDYESAKTVIADFAGIE